MYFYEVESYMPSFNESMFIEVDYVIDGQEHISIFAINLIDDR